VLALEGQLGAAQEEGAAREAELRALIDALRADKRRLEEALESSGARANDELVTQVRLRDLRNIALAHFRPHRPVRVQVRGELAAVLAQHATQAAAMQQKLTWHAENASLLSASEALVRQQSETIAELRRRLAQAEAPAAGEDPTRVRALESRVMELQAALQRAGTAGEAAGRVRGLEARVLALQTLQSAEGAAVGGDVDKAALQAEAESLRARLAEVR